MALTAAEAPRADGVKLNHRSRPYRPSPAAVPGTGRRAHEDRQGVHDEHCPQPIYTSRQAGGAPEALKPCLLPPHAPTGLAALEKVVAAVRLQTKRGHRACR